MTIKNGTRIFGFLMVMISIISISCSKDSAGKKEATSLPSGHEKMVEQYVKGIEESKRTVIAKVNGVAISMADLVREMNSVAPAYIKPGQKKDPQTDEKVRKEALDRLIYRELAVQEAVRQGMKVPPEMIAGELKKIKDGLKTENAYKEKLSSTGMTEEDLKKQLERNLLVEMITEKEIFDKVKVDEEQVKKIYAKKKASYKTPSGKQMSFEEAHDQIGQELMKEAVAKREDEWVETLRRPAKIETMLAESAKGIHSVQ